MLAVAGASMLAGDGNAGEPTIHRFYVDYAVVKHSLMNDEGLFNELMEFTKRIPMLTIRQPVDFLSTRLELEPLFRYAHEHDVEKAGRYDAGSAAINLGSHHWQHLATREESETIGMFYLHRPPTPMLYDIETDEGFSLGTLCRS
jgi:hypothetical protein